MDASELLTEAQIRSGVTDVASRGDYYVRSAEKVLEKRLRVWAMVTTTTVTADANGVLIMPSDFLQLLTAGTANTSGISGVVPGSSNAVTYYASIPSILLGANWLSESEPETYIQAVLLQIYLAAGLADQATATLTVLNQLIAGITEADLRARYLNRSINFRGLMP